MEFVGMNQRQALKLLQGGTKGIAEWNKRRESGEDIPDLREADLGAANLSLAKLRGANLDHADLSHADLSGPFHN
jgi:uncharacterized protein YjbI with pentapeptide repeats